MMLYDDFLPGVIMYTTGPFFDRKQFMMIVSVVYDHGWIELTLLTSENVEEKRYYKGSREDTLLYSMCACSKVGL